MTSSFLRPIRSPKWPKTSAPIGPGGEPDGVGAEGQQRAGERSDCSGKNSAGKTSAAAEP